jgi:hypothetical protein
MTDPFRERVHRAVLLAAAAYNVLFGAWTVLWPGAFFSAFRLEPPRHPAVWSCLGMVVGLYGLLYAYAALRLDRARPIVAVGLLGKVLGPIGWVLAVRSGEWPVRTFPLIAFDDLVWWLPFTLILVEGTRAGARLRALAPKAAAVLNAAAAFALLLVLRPGTEAGGDVAQRAAYVRDHPVAWRAGWALWMAAGASLIAFYAWWGARADRRGAAGVAVAVGAAGLACDWGAEALYVGWLPSDFAAVARAGDLLTGGAANGLYSVAGAILTLATPSLPRGLAAWAWVPWTSGFALTAFTLAGFMPGMVVATAALMTSLCPWIWWTGRHLAARRTAA